MALSTFLLYCNVISRIYIAVNAQARKQNGGHCDVIYDIIIA